jgi:hypothetical protein
MQSIDFDIPSLNEVLIFFDTHGHSKRAFPHLASLCRLLSISHPHPLPQECDARDTPAHERIYNLHLYIISSSSSSHTFPLGFLQKCGAFSHGASSKTEKGKGHVCRSVSFLFPNALGHPACAERRSPPYQSIRHRDLKKPVQRGMWAKSTSENRIAGPHVLKRPKTPWKAAMWFPGPLRPSPTSTLRLVLSFYFLLYLCCISKTHQSPRHGPLGWSTKGSI